MNRTTYGNVPLHELAPRQGREIKSRRLELGLSRQRLASMAGCSSSGLGRVERGDVNGSSLLPKILHALEKAEEHPLPPREQTTTIGPLAKKRCRVTPEIAEEVRVRREALGATLEYMANLAGCCHTTWYNVERQDIAYTRYLPDILDALEEAEEHPELVREALTQDGRHRFGHPDYLPAGAVRTSPELGALVRERREEKGLTAEEMAGLCNVHLETVLRLERGQGKYSRLAGGILDFLDIPYSAAGDPCDRCGMLLFEDPWDIPPDWPPAEHIAVGSICLECWLEVRTKDRAQRERLRKRALQQVAPKLYGGNGYGMAH